MTVTDWASEPANWVFIVVALFVLVSAFRVVTAKNVVHAALFLVATLAGTAGLFLILSAEFVAWVLVLVYIGAVIVLFLFGIMITRAPTGYDEGLDGDREDLAGHPVADDVRAHGLGLSGGIRLDDGEQPG